MQSRHRETTANYSVCFLCCFVASFRFCRPICLLTFLCPLCCATPLLFSFACSKLQDNSSKLKKERDFHRMHHKRVGQEKNKLIVELKQTQEKYNVLKPQVPELQVPNALPAFWCPFLSFLSHWVHFFLSRSASLSLKPATN